MPRPRGGIEESRSHLMRSSHHEDHRAAESFKSTPYSTYPSLTTTIAATTRGEPREYPTDRGGSEARSDPRLCYTVSKDNPTGAPDPNTGLRESEFPSTSSELEREMSLVAEGEERKRQAPNYAPPERMTARCVCGGGVNTHL